MRKEFLPFSTHTIEAAEIYASDRILSLPLFPMMTDDDATDVVAAVKGVITKCSR